MNRCWGAVAFAGLLFFITSRAAATAAPGRDAAFEQALATQLMAIDPALVPTFQSATAAYDAGDYAKAMDGFAKVHAAAPSFTAATRRLGGAEVAAHHEAEGLAHCREAVKLEPSAENEGALAATLVGRPEATDADKREAKEYAAAAQQQKPDDPFVQQTVCQVALAQEDGPTLDQCSSRLVALAPNDPGAHVIRAIALGGTGDLGGGERELDRAHELGLPDPAYRDLRARFRQARPLYERAWSAAWPVVAAWALGLAALFGLGALLSAMTLRAARRPPRPETDADSESTAGERMLRRVYRFIVTVSALYFYVSIPLVATSVVVAAGALVVGAFMLGHVPIKLLLIVVAIALYTLVAIFRSLTTRVRHDAPGVPLDLAAEPKLRDVLAETAAKVGTRPVDAVYLVPDTTVAVTERGGLLKQLRGKAERALILGVGALEGLSVRPLKAVLAHEYGHFRNEDTAGGGIALAARRSLTLMAIHMATRGVATWFNPAWWFVRGYGAVYLRISQGASRLQEVLADRWAVRAYGADPFVTGLRHVVARTLEFDDHVETSLREVIERKAALVNLYTYAPETPAKSKDAPTRLDELWNREPSPYDSHPRGADREAYAQALGSTGAALRPGDDDPAWSLFHDRAAIEEAMTREVRANVERRHGIVIASS